MNLIVAIVAAFVLLCMFPPTVLVTVPLLIMLARHRAAVAAQRKRTLQGSGQPRDLAAVYATLGPR